MIIGCFYVCLSTLQVPTVKLFHNFFYYVARALVISKYLNATFENLLRGLLCVLPTSNYLFEDFDSKIAWKCNIGASITAVIQISFNFFNQAKVSANITMVFWVSGTNWVERCIIQEWKLNQLDQLISWIPEDYIILCQQRGLEPWWGHAIEMQ